MAARFPQAKRVECCTPKFQPRAVGEGEQGQTPHVPQTPGPAAPPFCASAQVESVPGNNSDL